MAGSGKRRPAKRSTLKNKCDRLFSIYIRARDKVCQKCGRVENLQCAHLVSRGYMNTRWDDRNAIALCMGCHKFFTHRPIEWDEFIVERIGAEAYQQIRKHARRTDLRVDYDIVLPELEGKVRNDA